MVLTLTKPLLPLPAAASSQVVDKRDGVEAAEEHEQASDHDESINAEVLTIIIVISACTYTCANEALTHSVYRISNFLHTKGGDANGPTQIGNLQREDVVENDTEEVQRCVKCNGIVNEGYCDECDHKAGDTVSTKYMKLVSNAAQEPTKRRSCRPPTLSRTALLNLADSNS